MNFPDGLFNNSWAMLAILPYALLLFRALRTAPWRRLGDDVQMHVYFGAMVVLTLIWSLKAGVRPGLNLHLLGVTAFTLMFGRQLAMIGLSVVLAAVTLNAGLKLGDPWLGWQPFALNALVLAMFPVFVTDLIRRLVERYLPAHLFIYFLVVAFLGAWVSFFATGALTGLLLWLGGAYSLDLLLDDYLLFYVLLGFGEGWLNGAAITLMVMYFPAWVGSFDDRRYLWNKKPTD